MIGGTDELELVDLAGAAIGTIGKLAAHQPPGQLHRAFSVFLFDSNGRMLLQRRALTKYHSPGVWSNACCGHPAPGQDPREAASRRTIEELGVAPQELRVAGTVDYLHPDSLSGLVEHEYNHLFVGLVDPARLHPDSAEVAEILFVSQEELIDMQQELQFSAWFPTVLQAVRPSLDEYLFTEVVR